MHKGQLMQRLKQLGGGGGTLFGLGLLALLLTACGAGADAATVVPTSPPPRTSTEIRIGVLATLTGTFTVLGEDALRGVGLAMAEVGGKIGNTPVTLVTASTNTSPTVARDAVRKLVEQDHVDLVIGPLSGDEGLAVRDYAKTQPDMVFINGSSGAPDTTLRDPARNFYRFNPDGAQLMAGLGTYVYRTKGYKRVVTLAEDYSYPYSQVGGFMTEFCREGGKVVGKFWVPLGTSNYSVIVAAIPRDIDAIYVALGGTDAVNFLTQYEQAGGQAHLIGGSILVDSTILGVKGALYNHVLGLPSASAVVDENPDPAWQKFVAAYRAKYPDGLTVPSLFAQAYYINTKAALLGLQQVDGDLSNGATRLKTVLDTLQFDTPTGPVRLDHNRQAIADIYIREVTSRPDGTLTNQLVKTINAVNETLGLPEATLLQMGRFGRDNPSCP